MTNRKNLILLRHAKSSWNHTELDDRDRPLNGRGRRAASAMGRWMENEAIVPDYVLCSSAKRTRETASLFFADWNGPPPIVFRDDLYHASPAQIESIVNSIDDSIEDLMIIGHNPGLEEFLNRHTGNAIEVPTAALAQINFELDSWSQFKDVTSGTLFKFVRPGDI